MKGTTHRRGATTAVIVEAWSRGWLLDQIGFAAGLSGERVRQLIEKYERKHGAVERFSRHRERSAKQAWHCACCGKVQWSKLGRFKETNRESMVCSMTCYAMLRIKIPDKMIEVAIDRRWQGKSWTSIEIELGCPVQTIQTRIWTHLYRIDLLNMEMVESIWQRGGHKCAWNWLERKTGIICTENGPRLERSQYRNQNPWGIRLMREQREREQSA